MKKQTYFILFASFVGLSVLTAAAFVVLYILTIVSGDSWLSYTLVCGALLLGAVGAVSGIIWDHAVKSEKILLAENLYNLGKANHFYDYQEFAKKVKDMKKKLPSDKESYMITFTSSHYSMMKNSSRNPAVIELNGYIGDYLTETFITNKELGPIANIAFCFYHGQFLIYVIGSKDQVTELIEKIQNKIYSIVENNSIKMFVQPFFGIALFENEETLPGVIDNVFLARDLSEKNFEVITIYDHKFRKTASKSELQEIKDAISTGLKKDDLRSLVYNKDINIIYHLRINNGGLKDDGNHFTQACGGMSSYSQSVMLFNECINNGNLNFVKTIYNGDVDNENQCGLGGISGLSSVNTKFYKCENHGTVKGDSNHIAGISGWSIGSTNNGGYFYNCLNDGEIIETRAVKTNCHVANITSYKTSTASNIITVLAGNYANVDELQKLVTVYESNELDFTGVNVDDTTGTLVLPNVLLNKVHIEKKIADKLVLVNAADNVLFSGADLNLEVAVGTPAIGIEIDNASSSITIDSGVVLRRLVFGRHQSINNATVVNNGIFSCQGCDYPVHMIGSFASLTITNNGTIHTKDTALKVVNTTTNVTLINNGVITPR